MHYFILVLSNLHIRLNSLNKSYPKKTFLNNFPSPKVLKHSLNLYQSHFFSSFKFIKITHLSIASSKPDQAHKNYIAVTNFLSILNIFNVLHLAATSVLGQQTFNSVPKE
jgi:hypothetical protein